MSTLKNKREKIHFIITFNIFPALIGLLMSIMGFNFFDSFFSESSLAGALILFVSFLGFSISRFLLLVEEMDKEIKKVLNKNNTFQIGDIRDLEFFHFNPHFKTVRLDAVGKNSVKIVTQDGESEEIEISDFLELYVE